MESNGSVEINVTPAGDGNKLNQTLEWFRSNLEIFLIAFVLAMTIRCFCIDGFKIPSASMEPTLRGDPRTGDRIIADKFRLLISPIERYDVILFKYPLDRTKNFIKRVVGIPNEEIKTKYGNMYYRPKGESEYKIARKPLDIQESIWLPVWSWVPVTDSIKKRWALPSSTELYEITNNQLKLYANKSPDGKVSLELNGDIKDNYIGRGGGITGEHTVTDIKIGFKCVLSGTSSAVCVKMNTFSGVFNLHLSTDQENYLEYKGKKIVSINEKLIPLKQHLVEFLNYDKIVYIKLDGVIISEYDYNELPDDDYIVVSHPQITIEAYKTEVSFRDINLYRDIYYELSPNNSDKTQEIGGNKYFVIGDNVPNSRDSRAWRMKTFYLKNGKVIQCDASSTREISGYVEVYKEADGKGGDIWGNTHKIPIDQIIEEKTIEEDCPFVDFDNIFGKALFVYWPLRNIKIIR
ncbi:MAG: signal peptidase I [Planctomycetes bacterium]|nr:signal peptidase I [Planctomycetota bacterium]